MSMGHVQLPALAFTFGSGVGSRPLNHAHTTSHLLLGTGNRNSSSNSAYIRAARGERMEGLRFRSTPPAPSPPLELPDGWVIRPA